MKAKLAAKANSIILKKKAKVKGKAKPRLSQYELESAILRRCAAGRDQLDKTLAPGVELIQLKPGSTGQKSFPRAWTRFEGSRRTYRGTAEWCIPHGADTKRRMLFLHGGSYVVWAPLDAEYRSIISKIAVACKMCVLAVDYRLAEEHRFPAAYDDSLAALTWLAEHGPQSSTEESLATDLFVCGDSAGGGLALAVCLGAQAKIRRLLRGVIPLSAWIDMTASTPSYDTRCWDAKTCFGDAVNPGTDRKSGQDEAEGYLGRGGVKKYGRDWRCSPLFAPVAKLRQLPAILFQVGDFELILDESRNLHERIKKIGHKDSTLSVYPRMWHCFQEYCEGGGERQPLAKALQAIREIGCWVRAR